MGDGLARDIGRPDPRIDRTVAFEPDSGNSSLDGTAVWKALVGQGKAFDVSAFSVKALLHNLDTRDYGRPLDELRDLFWSSPRLPLLPGGEADLQRAIFAAVSNGELRLVGPDGVDRAVTRPADIAIGSSGLHLLPPRQASTPDQSETAHEFGTSATAKQGEGAKPADRTLADPASVTVTTAAGASPSLTGGSGTDQGPSEREVTFSLMTSMSDPDTQDAVRRLFLTLSNVVDEGQMTWAQIQVKIVVADEAAESIEKDIRDTGTAPSIRSV